MKDIWSRHKLIIWNKQRDIITLELELGLRYFFSTHRLIMLYICTKFHGGVLNGFKVIKRTRNIAIWNLTLKCGLDLHWTGLIDIEFCTSSWYGEHLSKVCTFQLFINPKKTNSIVLTFHFFSWCYLVRRVIFWCLVSSTCQSSHGLTAGQQSNRAVAVIQCTLAVRTFWMISTLFKS